MKAHVTKPVRQVSPAQHQEADLPIDPPPLEESDPDTTNPLFALYDVFVCSLLPVSLTQHSCPELLSSARFMNC